MATIHKEFELPIPAEAAWAALRDFGAVDRLAAGFVTACALEEEGAVRRVTFFNGMEARERLVTLDDAARRIVYSASGARATHHNASAQVVATGADSCRFVWITDLLPDALAPAIGQMMEQGVQAMRSALTPQAR
ncbi:SRPBCC family protein [Ramlibacter alkalitolerans]|uniref:SRPBCC family protein n=1 Tax=Ramlibacter alkalitolerans TaxID=2039631 RepID=A0ABS1JMD6_9BURK|nr:SRPBCC family protein [Ramlibacter alkalitolerans]MBL0425041.1 SRPBCC family protein [Ramlibacter alkalitolerans]